MSNWTPDWEITQYWDKVMASEQLTEVYRREFEADLRELGLDKYDLTKGVMADVGGGAFGGVFAFRRLGERRLLVDPLASTFAARYGQISKDIELLDGVAQCLPLPRFALDVMFSIETLDHCNSLEEFFAAVAEMGRVVKPGGLMFFMMPYRDKSRDGHYISQETLTLMKLKDALSIAFTFESFRDKVMGNHIFAVCRREPE